MSKVHASHTPHSASRRRRHLSQASKTKKKFSKEPEVPPSNDNKRKVSHHVPAPPRALAT